ncbi:hypothetical protein [Thermostichus vulcanus]|uniref:Uncharacterized protein n=1 Tax=Thermostichus vulcanus str. 'Rupite' TaxID=2813851 RepID=A0ABT0CD33_THEVL|nr:hypothetical protein [Thermostichus vulcanus]MCJ2543698.1 hypothetical protein [Thermostichus vulcanus str. 'Rupite']
MASQWSEGINLGKKELWNALKKWLIDYVSKAKEVIQESHERTINLALNELDKQRQELNAQTDIKTIIIDSLEERKKWIEEALESLSAVGR